MSITPTPLERLTLVLASASPARLATLRAAGIEASVDVSNIDEDAALAGLPYDAPSAVCGLAVAKAREVASRHQSERALILGCDSMLEIDGEIWGKPHTPALARERLARMAGRSGILHTGHCLASAASGGFIAGVSHATVHIAPMSEAEIAAYVATGEPLEVAGSFTVDGIGGPFIERIDGDYHGVVGLSLPLLRAMMADVGLSITQLWAEHTPAFGSLGEKAERFLSPAFTFTGRRSADGFLLCGCGQSHWGLAGAGGIAAFRMEHGQLQVLLQLRSAFSHGGATWGIPGGALEWKESIRAGAAREFSEETGIEGASLTFLSPALSPELSECEGYAAHRLIHPDWHFTTFPAICEGASDPIPDRESQELRWVPADAPLPEPLHPAFAHAWPALRRCAEVALGHARG